MEKRYLTVSALNQYLKAKLDQDQHLKRIYLQGEISNLKRHSSGHCYFTLKDDKSRISAVMFASYFSKLNFKLEEGMKVFLIGSVSVYPVSGDFQLYVYQMEPDGIGQLYLKFEQLKKKLFKEGYFEESHKKEIKKFPETIGVITGYPSAALEDVLKTIQQRYPLVKVKIFPTLVQGNNAYLSIIEAIKLADNMNLDTLILSRGGGSLEHLWNFNEEELVKTIYHCQTPIITGVGHEVDTTLVDYVSDLRAVTPTAAANLAVPDLNELRMKVDHQHDYLITLIQHRYSRDSGRYELLSQHPLLLDPMRILIEKQHRLEQYQNILHYQTKNILQVYLKRHQHYHQKLELTSQSFIMNNKNKLLQYQQFLQKEIEHQFNMTKREFASQIERLDLVSPLNIIKRGYALIESNKKIITKTSQLKSGDDILIQLSDGKVEATIKE